MGFMKNAKINAVRADAEKAYADGRAVFTSRLNFPTTMHGMSGEIPDWSLMVECIEAAGWQLSEWSVAMDREGRPEAYPLFRRV
jgi:hypothetical protein